MKYYIFLLITFLLNISIYSQNISVASFQALPNDMSARIDEPKTDLNGDKCAIIKVVTTETDFAWDVGTIGIIAAVKKIGEYWIYVSWGTKRITISHDKLGVLRNYVFPQAIEKSMVYELVLTTGKVTTIVEEKKLVTQWLMINSNPSGAEVYIDDKLAGTTPFQRKYEEGKYNYRLEQPRYNNYVGVIDLQGTKKDIEAKLVPKFGNITISSLPESGMNIFLNGKDTEQKTPATLKDVNSGEHTIKLQSQWYQSQTKKVDVADEQTTSINFTLEPAFAELTINAEPQADILIDGTKKGAKTYNGRILEGIYTIKAEKEKYSSQEKQLKIIAGNNENLSFTLKGKTGAIDIITTPMKAQISINKKDYGTTPNTIENLLVGSYDIILSKDGFGTITKTIEITENNTTEINEALPQGEKITINTTPTGADIYIDNNNVGKTPYNNTLSYGTHKIKLINGKKTVEESISVSQGGKTSWSFDVSEFAAKGTFADSRDGKTYKYVTIGKQIWMAENLNYSTNSGSWCYDDKNSNCNKYGRLYNWATALNVCPSGWHLPTDAEWTVLTDYLGSNAGSKLAGNAALWTDGSLNQNADFGTSGFSALPGGYRVSSNGSFNNLGNYGYWWSSTEYGGTYAWFGYLYYSNAEANRNIHNKSHGFGVRCLRD